MTKRLSRNFIPVCALLLLGGCDRYHNPNDLAKITALQQQLNEAKTQESLLETRAVQAEKVAIDSQNAYRERIAGAAERQADAAEDQALTAELNRIDRQ